MSQEKMLEKYDEAMLSDASTFYYGSSNFYNFGYWVDGATTQREASERLVAELLSKVSDGTGKTLDVACGVGGSTRVLLQHNTPENVTAINLSGAQLERAKQSAPGCTFLLMDAVKLDFPDETFDTVMCVEAAFHFDTREQYLREALRVLKPGGYLIQSDILGSPSKWWGTSGSLYFPPENHIESVDAYIGLLARIGFERIEVTDATQECWGGFRDHLRRSPGEARKTGIVDTKQFLRSTLGIWTYTTLLGWFVRHYVLSKAQKPLSPIG